MQQNDARSFRIAVIPGDGIGREVVPAALQVLEPIGKRFSIRFDFHMYDWGSEYYFRHGLMMPANALNLLRATDAILLGAIGDPG
ncbi:MAG TPA: isocitrate/isopropylmalate family dehydrogenase, partial [Terriglobia bacterium]|nr:isocitrate/isopropylmalate family dehydrogenase [Terriglobia bacterium]